MSGISVPSFVKNLNFSATMKIPSGFAFGISGAFRIPNDEVSDQEAERIIREAIRRSFQIPYKPLQSLAGKALERRQFVLVLRSGNAASYISKRVSLS
jgi:hypothetical protein